MVEVTFASAVEDLQRYKIATESERQAFVNALKEKWLELPREYKTGWFKLCREENIIAMEIMGKIADYLYNKYSEEKEYKSQKEIRKLRDQLILILKETKDSRIFSVLTGGELEVATKLWGLQEKPPPLRETKIREAKEGGAEILRPVKKEEFLILRVDSEICERLNVTIPPKVTKSNKEEKIRGDYWVVYDLPSKINELLAPEYECVIRFVDEKIEIVIKRK